MTKRPFKHIVMITLIAVAVIVAYLWNSLSWLFYREEGIATELRHAGAHVQLSKHKIVLVSFSTQPATVKALELLAELCCVETLQMNCDFQQDRGYPIETSSCKITDQGLAHLQRLSSIKRLTVNLEGTIAIRTKLTYVTTDTLPLRAKFTANQLSESTALEESTVSVWSIPVRM